MSEDNNGAGGGGGGGETEAPQGPAPQSPEPAAQPQTQAPEASNEPEAMRAYRVVQAHTDGRLFRVGEIRVLSEQDAHRVVGLVELE